MEKLFKTPIALFLGVFAIFLVSSCQKNGQSPSKTTTFGTVNTTAFNTSQAIALDATAGDTVYAVNTCHHGDRADTVAFSTLPDTIGKYLTANYPGYTLKAAYKISEHSGSLEGYIVAITFNGNPVGVAFNASGIFVKVLEQREGRDLHDDRGWHEGGRFGDRDGHHHDTIALTALPTAITSYFATNYPKDTLKHALRDRDSSIDVISIDTGVFVSEFTAAGSFVKRIEVYPHVLTRATLAQAALPAAISTYLTATYPAYVFDAAYAISLKGTLKGYLVFIDANSTKYLVRFDAGGNFVKAIVIH